MINLIFDYDGTLHNSIKIYAPAFRFAYAHLVLLGVAEKKEWTDSEISKWLGFSSKDMWNAFMPKLSPSIKNKCSDIIGSTMVELVNQGKAELYENSLSTLESLKEKGYTLIFLSNCKRNYMDAHTEIFQLKSYFESLYCTQDYNFAPKHEIFKVIQKKYKGECIVIGDRFQDIEIAQKHGLLSIGCAYGYGAADEIAKATYIVNAVDQIEICLLQHK